MQVALSPHDPGRAAVAPSQITLDLNETLSTALSQCGRGLGVTQSTIIQAAWAILLGRLTGRAWDTRARRSPRSKDFFGFLVAFGSRSAPFSK